MKTPYLKSLTTALEVLRYIGEENREVGVTDISKKLNLPKSTVQRVLSTLRLNNYVDQNCLTKKYTIGLRAFEIGSNFLRRGNLIDIATPVMSRLAKECGFSVNLAVLDKELGEIIYVHRVESEKTVGVYARVGRRGFVHSTALGKILLSFLDQNEQQTILAGIELPKLTNRTIISRENLMSELVQIKKQGYSLDRGEEHIQIRCVAAPIRDVSGKVIAAVSISGLSGDKPFKSLDDIAIRIKKAGQEISGGLGYRL